MAKKPAPKKAAPKSKTAAKSPPKGKGASSKEAVKRKNAAKPKPALKSQTATKAAPKSSAKPVEKKPAAKPTPSPKPVLVKPAAPAPASKPVPAVTPTLPPVPVPKPAVSPAPAPAFKQAAGRTSVLTVAAQAVPGQASAGNTQPANILVLVTCAGEAVADLNLDHFSIMEHFDVPGQLYPFSNNIVGFKNAGTGAYQLQVKPISNSPWKGGQHLAQILVATEDERQGQAAVKLIIR